MLRRDDLWIWDSWPVEDGDDRHLFYLQAPRALGDPIARHTHAAVGHAVSADWEHWTILPDALTTAPSPAWDDLAIWTGSIVRGDTGRWHFFYTAISHGDGGRVQRIGRADSDDLITWHRAGAEPLLCADPRWYETVDQMDWHEETWRDPWVLRDPAGDGWHMLITARARNGPRYDRGVIGHARSADFGTWEVQPPLTARAGFGHMEVPQVSMIDGRPVLTFCCLAPELSAERRQATPMTGMWSAPATSIIGPYDVAAAIPFDDPSIYAAHLVNLADGKPALLGFADDRDGHGFDGAIPPPIPVILRPDGTVTHR
ncbi:glycosyl hydrolase family 32 [Actinoplanes sp. CA-030573]|uniref:glycosyl hydrolase family 32 n=1 Tax=Actinoplanes sp. CA-030573 TaxID=3239898 RepID=UPI003D92C73E